MGLGSELLVAERSDGAAPLVAQPGELTRLQTDNLGNLKVVISGPALPVLDGLTTQPVNDRVNQRVLEEILLTLRAILNHQRAVSYAAGMTVDEDAPTQVSS